MVNKIDLLPYVDFDLDACRRHVAAVNPGTPVVALSATRGDNLDAWYGWLSSCSAPGAGATPGTGLRR